MGLMTYVHGYFDKLVDPMFQRDEAGRELFFPMGIGSRGRVVPDAARSASIRLSLKRAWIGFLTFIFVLLTSLPFVLEGLSLDALRGLTKAMHSVWVYVIPVALVILLQLALTRHLARGLEVTGRKMNLRNQTASVAMTNSQNYIWLMISVSSALTVMCAVMALSPATLELPPSLPRWFGPSIGGGGTVFFAGITAMWIKIALVKRRAIA